MTGVQTCALPISLEEKGFLIYGDGHQIRDYTYISDVIEGTILATKKNKTFGEVYNIRDRKSVV